MTSRNGINAVFDDDWMSENVFSNVDEKPPAAAVMQIV
jgi:hypothetical protein